MKKAVFLIITLLFLSCTQSGDNNDCFPSVNVNETVNLDLPQFIDLQVIGGFTTTRLGLIDVLIIRRTSNFQAFDLRCPEQDCTSLMSFDGLKLICPCDEYEYNSLNGSPETEGASCFAKEYRVESLSSSILRITNF